jgi:shikimate dehydrogenase
MGSPIAHSLSPELHRAAYAELGLTGWTYQAIEVDEAALAGTIDQLGPEWVGVSLTMPLKQAILPMLDEVSDLARCVGAVNTVTFRDGRRLGDNTDVVGIVSALAEAGVRTAERSVVLGGGATATSAVAALQQLGDPEPLVLVRSLSRATGIYAAAEQLGVRPWVRSWEHVPEALAAADLVICTLPPGAGADLVDVVTASPPNPGATLLDVAYRPWPTRLAAAWVSEGGRAVAGLEMLLHQAAAQVALWSGRVPSVAIMRSAAEAILVTDGDNG